MKSNIKSLCLAAMFMAIGLLLPFVTGNIPQIGRYLCPMHIPVFLCGLICGWRYGLAVGFITPLLRSVLFHMPALYPSAVGMAFELATYGVCIAVLFRLFKKKNAGTVYLALIPSMLVGRLIWGIARTVMLGLSGPDTASFGFSYFITAGFVEAIPGIILQLILIPVIMHALIRAKLVHNE